MNFDTLQPYQKRLLRFFLSIPPGHKFVMFRGGQGTRCYLEKDGKLTHRLDNGAWVPLA